MTDMLLLMMVRLGEHVIEWGGRGDNITVTLWRARLQRTSACSYVDLVAGQAAVSEWPLTTVNIYVTDQWR